MQDRCQVSNLLKNILRRMRHAKTFEKELSQEIQMISRHCKL